MTNRKIRSMSFFISRSFFIGYGYSLILSLINKDGWIALILGTLIGIILVFGISKIKKDMKDLSLKEYLKQNKYLKYPALIIFFCFFLFLLIEILFILETFASSFFLIKSPPYFILLPVVYLIYRIAKKNWTTIGRVAEILMPFSLIIIIVSLSILVFYGSKDNFLPILTVKNKDLFACTFYVAFYSTAPFLLLLDCPMKEVKLVKNYLLGMITIVITGIIIIAVLGPNLIQIYRFPAYMILKKIQIFDFLEKIENIISVSWILDLFFLSAISGNNLKQLLPKKKNNFTFPLLLFLVFIGTIYLSKIYQFELQIYHILPLILGGFELVLISILFLYKIVLKKGCRETK